MPLSAESASQLGLPNSNDLLRVFCNACEIPELWRHSVMPSQLTWSSVWRFHIMLLGDNVQGCTCTCLPGLERSWCWYFYQPDRKHDDRGPNKSKNFIHRGASRSSITMCCPNLSEFKSALSEESLWLLCKNVWIIGSQCYVPGYLHSMCVVCLMVLFLSIYLTMFACP